MYERIPNYQLQGFDDEVVRDTQPPLKVLEKCQEFCLRDRSSTNTNMARPCSSFDFQPGSRINGNGNGNGNGVEYEESTCYLTQEQAEPEGIGHLMYVPNSVHFSEICIICKFFPFTKMFYKNDFQKNRNILVFQKSEMLKYI